ncbi:MAG TPA: sigma 54-interacting transcriptional regulator [Candidatus Acidoferrales bacterium]|jgi:formate hydrogenlyase transcriptional activator|nr:sigma 54-interacting transcriptional regulator [Candidatus Acidoferrales bacterium]
MATFPITWSETLAKRYEALLHVFRSLSLRTPDEMAHALADELRLVLDFDFLDAIVYKERTKEVEWSVGTCPVSRSSVPIEETAGWWIYQNQQTLSIADWSRDARFPAVREALRSLASDTPSFLGVPLTSPHRNLGVLAIASAQPHAYSEEEISFLSSVSDGLAMAIDASLNFETSRRAQSELERQNSRLKLLLDLTNRVTSSLDLHELLRSTAASIRELMDCDYVPIGLRDAHSERFQIYAQDFPLSRGFFREQIWVSPIGQIRNAFDAHKPILLTEIKPANHSPEVYERLVGEGIRSVWLIPLVSRGCLLGFYGLGRRGEESFSDDDSEFLVRIGSQIAIAVENALAFREISDLKNKLAQEKLYLEDEIRSEMDFEEIVGRSPALRHVLELVETVAQTDSTVLLLGETGTGKELIARAVHDHSRRKSSTFVKLNCAAIPTGLLESELFGHEKGAFTGAIAQKLGRMELADQGTLFLDEVGDIPLEIQPKLLRALQEREFERLGSNHTRKANVRLVAATNRDLENMIASQQFRSDLYYRLNVFPIRIPPLRERKEDIPLLVSYFVQKYSRQMQKDIDTVPGTALKTLSSWHWPGNIRELENFIERAVILTRGKSLEAPLGELKAPAASSPPVDRRGSVGRDYVARIVRETIEGLSKVAPNRDREEETENRRSEILRVLRETDGRVGGTEGAAARMSIKRTTLISRMKKLGIDANELE